MAWKDIRIAKKLYLGFGAVLLLTAIVGYVSVSGFMSVSRTSSRLEAYNQLDKWVGDLAVARRDFYLTGDQKYAEKLRSTLDKFFKLMDETSAKVDDQLDQQGIEEIRKQATAYKSGFEDYALFSAELKQCDDKMVETGRTAQASAMKLGSGDGLQLANYILEARRHEKNYQLRGDKKYIDEVVKAVSANLALCSQLKSRTRSSEQQATVNATFAAVQGYKAAFDQYVTAKDKQNEVGASVGVAAAGIISGCAELTKRSREKVASTQSAAMTLTLVFASLAIVVGVLVALVISKGISTPLQTISRIAEEVSVGDVEHTITIDQRDEIGTLAASFRKLVSYMSELSDAAQRIAGNDLTVTINPKSAKDMLGNSFRTMVGNLTAMVRQMSENARELVSAATQIASSAEEMSKGAKDQASQIGQVSAAVEEMTATILESSRHASDAAGAAKGAAETATSGGRTVNDTIHGMQKIASVVRESADSITKLAASASQIGEIIGVIDDIADQTNLLALNAAIEAARAGDQGRGFAVVADEVRKLAERTGKATGEITEMIKGVQRQTEDAVGSMEAGIQEVDKGRSHADLAGNSLNEIVSMAQRVTDMVSQIASATGEQSSAAEQISKSIEHISSVTKETANGAEQSAAAAEELNRQADGLQQMVQRFKVNA